MIFLFLYQETKNVHTENTILISNNFYLILPIITYENLFFVGTLARTFRTN